MNFRQNLREKQNWLIVAVFAAAMAWVEAAVVVYLRALINRFEPYQHDPLPVSVGLGEIELIREAATMVMLLTVGWLAGRNIRSRLAYAVLAFGIWDILYYVFLIPTSGWPNSILDWDILFLIPLPWWGPVLAPVSIAFLMIIGGSLVSQSAHSLWPGRVAWGVCFAGMGIALYVFMADAIQIAPKGVAALRNMLPTSFNWPLFCLGLALMSVPILEMAWQRWGRPVPESLSYGEPAD